MMTAAAILNLYDYYQQQKRANCITQPSCDSQAPVLPPKQPSSAPCDVESEPVSSSLTESEEDTTLAITTPPPVEAPKPIAHNNHGDRSDEEEPELTTIFPLEAGDEDDPILGSTQIPTNENSGKKQQSPLQLRAKRSLIWNQIRHNLRIPQLRQRTMVLWSLRLRMVKYLAHLKFNFSPSRGRNNRTGCRRTNNNLQRGK